MGAHQRRSTRNLGIGFGQLVQTLRQAFGQPATVDEDQRRALRLDQLQQTRVDGRPDGVARLGTHLGAQDRPARRRRIRLRVVHVLERHHHLEVQLLAFANVYQRDGPVHPTQEASHLVERALGGGEPDALNVSVGDVAQAFQRQRQVRAAFGAGHRVDLVDDHPAHRPQDLLGSGREEQIQRFGRGDQNVGRGAVDIPPVGGGCVAGADGDVDGGRRQPETLGGEADADQRRLQVALDVMRQGLQRRDVQYPAALLRVR